MRKIAGTLLAVAIAAAGVIALIAFLDARDDSTAGDAAPRNEPGETIPPQAGGRLLARGNVVLRYSEASFAPRLRRLADELGAPDEPELRAAGQAVVLRRDARTGGVVALARGHRLAVAGPGHPGLQAFVERWLGRGASR